MIEVGEVKTHVGDQAVRSSAVGIGEEGQAARTQRWVMGARGQGVFGKTPDPGVDEPSHQHLPLYPTGKTKSVFNTYSGTAENCQNVRQGFPFLYRQLWHCRCVRGDGLLVWRCHVISHGTKRPLKSWVLDHRWSFTDDARGVTLEKIRREVNKRTQEICSAF